MIYANPNWLRNYLYANELLQDFEKKLSYVQEKDLDTLISMRNAVEPTELDYALIFGMQIKSVID